jgi:hypothetical protein
MIVLGIVSSFCKKMFWKMIIHHKLIVLLKRIIKKKN